MSDDTQRIRAALEAGIARLETGQTQLCAELTRRLGALGNRLTATGDDIAVHYGTAESVRHATDTTRDELRALGDVVMAMEQ